MKGIFDKIKYIKWKRTAIRKEALIFLSMTDGWFDLFKKTTNINWGYNKVIRTHLGEITFPEEDLDNLAAIFKKNDDNQFSDFRKRLLKHVQALDRLAKKIEGINSQRLKDNQLLKLAQDYVETAMKAQNFLFPMIPIDKELSNRMLELLPKASEEKKQGWLRIFTFPKKVNSHTDEQRSFYNLANNYEKKNFKKLLKKHLKEFAWIGARGYSWNYAWTEKEVTNRIEFFLKQGKDPKKELFELNKIRKDMKQQTKNLVKELSIKKSSRLYKLINVAKEYAYLRTWRTDIIYHAGYRAKEMFFEIGKRANMEGENLKYYTYREFLKTAKNKKAAVSNAEINKRKEMFALITFNREQTVLSGKKAERTINKLFKQEKKRQSIKGLAVFKGKVKGTAKIVTCSEEISKIKEGDILIAAMTHPNYVPAMEKAAAFVTNEGGILCHASIIAREMKKPCIIATKIATKVFKDGDIVEVDAEKGVVRKIR